MSQEEKINLQRSIVEKTHPALELYAPCTIGNGVVQLSDAEWDEERSYENNKSLKKTFFIPASGAGTRMFQFLFDFIEEPNDENRGDVEKFLNHIEEFAFFFQFPKNIQEQLRNRSMDIEQFVAYILNQNGKGLAHLPKGLISFHKFGPFLLNPLQEHVLQGLEVDKNAAFHFTVSPQFEKDMDAKISMIKELSGNNVHVDFSIQNPDSHVFAFYSNGDLVKNEDGSPMMRPAGHGALLENLQEIDSDQLILKNIDNVQHFERSQSFQGTVKVLSNLQFKLRNELNQLISNTNQVGFLEAFKTFNSKWQLFDEQIYNLPNDEIFSLLSRPLRVCGMVRNEGQAGGGPFWIRETNGIISKQIVEKAQISFKADQYKIMIQATHFNPVLMVCQCTKMDGSKLNFSDFSDDTKYFVVNKRYLGKSMRFIELPGLWNGGMAHWNTVFLEIPSETFSPVKTILDLLEDSHKADK